MSSVQGSLYSDRAGVSSLSHLPDLCSPHDFARLKTAETAGLEIEISSSRGQPCQFKIFAMLK